MKIYKLLGDGELAEGQVWETVMFATHYQLDNLCIAVDVNEFQIDGATKEVMNTEPLDSKFVAFGCNVIKIDGHNFVELEHTFRRFYENLGTGKPTEILMKTVKGKGISFIDIAGWHRKAPNVEQLEQGIIELAITSVL